MPVTDAIATVVLLGCWSIFWHVRIVIAWRVLGPSIILTAMELESEADDGER